MIEIAFIMKCIGGAFTAFLTKEYLDFFLVLKRENKLFLTIGIGIFGIAQVLIEIGAGQIPNLTLLCSIMSLYLFAFFCYEGNAVKKVLITAIWIILSLIVEVAVAMGLVALGKDYMGVAVISTVVTKLLLLLIVMLLRYVTSMGEGHGEIPVKYSLLMVAVPVSSIYIIINIFRLCNSEDANSIFAIIASILFLVINFIVIVLFERLANEVIIQKKNIAFEQQLEMCTRQTEEREEALGNARKMRHDLNHHLVYLDTLAKNGKTEELNQYIAELLEQSHTASKELSNSGNLVVDGLLNYKCANLREEGIDLSIEVKIPEKLPIWSGDLCIALGNTLDNAIEAVHKMTGEGRFIAVKLNYRKEVLCISVQNSYNGKILKSGSGKLRTTKKNRVNHGIGLDSIEKSIRKYDGDLNLSYTDSVFTVTMLLYQQNMNQTAPVIETG